MASARLQSSMSRRKRPARLVHSESTHTSIAPSATASTSLRDTPHHRTPRLNREIQVMLTAMAERAPLSRLVGGLALAAAASQLLAASLLGVGVPSLGAAFLVDAVFASSMLGAALIA